MAVVLCGGCGREDQVKQGTSILADVNGSRLITADREPENWMTHGRTYNEVPGELSHEDAADIRAYVIFRRNQGVAQKSFAAARKD